MKKHKFFVRKWNERSFPQFLSNALTLLWLRANFFLFNFSGSTIPMLTKKWSNCVNCLVDTIESDKNTWKFEKNVQAIYPITFTRYQMPIIITWHAFSAQNHRTNICYAIPWRKCAVISKYHFLFVNQEATEHKITNFRFSVICLFGKTLTFSKYLTQQIVNWAVIHVGILSQQWIVTIWRLL